MAPEYNCTLGVSGSIKRSNSMQLIEGRHGVEQRQGRDSEQRVKVGLGTQTGTDISGGCQWRQHEGTVVWV